MSKVKKKKTSPDTELSQKDVRLEKTIQFTGWFFLLAIILFMGFWVLFDTILDWIDIVLDASAYAFIVYTVTNAAVCFAIATYIKNHRENKRKIYHDWILGELFFTILAIFAVAVYQW